MDASPGPSPSGTQRIDVTPAAQPPGAPPRDWVAAQRRGIELPGDYLVIDQAAGGTIVDLTREWTRIGRSLAADIRLDDPTVSRRHALIVRQGEGIRVLDDRSMNGVFVNGARVEWRELHDGDEIIVGRFHLHLVRATTRHFRRSRDDRQQAFAAS